MNSKNLLHQSSLAHKVTPSKNAWITLEAKLERNRSNKKVAQYRSMAIAAIMVLVVGFISFFISKINEMNINTDAAQNYTVQFFDSESNANAGLYDVNKLRHLKMAYNKHSDKSKI